MQKSASNSVFSQRCTTRKACGVLGIALLCLALRPAPARAQSLSDEELKRSIWNTTYESLGGQRVRAKLFLQGDSGHYDIPGAQGELAGVSYKLKVGGGAEITGNWSLGNSVGKFTFFVAGNSNPLIFSGAWQSAGRSGSWSGRFEGLQQPNAFTGGSATTAATVTYGGWQFNQPKGYYYRVCSFPAGAYQYVIYYPNKPGWVYWYNPEKSVFWCACPTVNNSKWGQDIANGKDLFLLASAKSGDVASTVFPDDDGANFGSGTATDKDGSKVDLGCPPTDLP